MAYLLRLPSGRTINLFFYDGPISRAVAFEDLLDRGENLANRLAGRLLRRTGTGRNWCTWPPTAKPTAITAATPTWRWRTRCTTSNPRSLARLTNYGEYLERHPPAQEVQIVENSSWSCIHGVERWRSNCGCNSGGHPGWNQQWRGPLRRCAGLAARPARGRIRKPRRGAVRRPLAGPRRATSTSSSTVPPASIERFLADTCASGDLSAAERITAWKLLELQRHAMLMYTSCGWFFDELSGIETVQVIQYAARALQLAQELTG